MSKPFIVMGQSASGPNGYYKMHVYSDGSVVTDSNGVVTRQMLDDGQGEADTQSSMTSAEYAEKVKSLIDQTRKTRSKRRP